MIRYCQVLAVAEFDEDKFAAASLEMDFMDGWTVLTKSDEISTRLNVDHLKYMPVSKLSDGGRKRVALAAAFVQGPDVLLLDEVSIYGCTKILLMASLYFIYNNISTFVC